MIGFSSRSSILKIRHVSPQSEGHWWPHSSLRSQSIRIFRRVDTSNYIPQYKEYNTHHISPASSMAVHALCRLWPKSPKPHFFLHLKSFPPQWCLRVWRDPLYFDRRFHLFFLVRSSFLANSYFCHISST